MNKQNYDPQRAKRVEVDKPCTLNPWGIPAKLENMSISGALVNSQELPDDMITTFTGELVVGTLKIPGEFVRLDKLKIGIEFDPVDSTLKKKVEEFLVSF